MCRMPIWLLPTLSLPSVKLGHEYPGEGISCSFHQHGRELSFEHRSKSRRSKVCTISRQARQCFVITSLAVWHGFHRAQHCERRGLCFHTDRKDLLTQNGDQQVRTSLILHKNPHSSPCNKNIKIYLKQFYFYSAANLSSWANCAKFHGKSANLTLFEAIPQNNLPSWLIFDCISFMPPLFFY